MLKTQDEMEKVMLSAEKEEEDKGSKEGREEEKEKEESDKDGDAKLEDGGDDKDKKAEAKLQAKARKAAPPAKAKDKKQSDVLNLNNEVVKMRKEVKRVRALIIRKLTRQIGNLKKKKGKEAEVERNQRRAARLLEEVHAMKELSPDLVTKTALQKNLNFENVCKNPKSTISDRATARIASHPQFNQKIQAIKAAVKAFKDERMKGGKMVEREKMQKHVEKTPQPPEQIEKEEEVIAVIPQKATDDEVGVEVIEVSDNATVGETEEKVHSDAPTAVQTHEIPEAKSEEPAVVKTSGVRDTERLKLQSQDAKKPPTLKPAPTELHGTPDEEESDLESSEDEEEKEYFDDSTEERFHKQSSQSEESEDDDFFLGKVSKFKKKKKPKVEGEEKKEEVKKGSEPPSDKLQSELDELESRLKSKGKPCQSVFCSSLAGAKAGRGGETGRGRGGARFRGSRGRSGPSRDFNQQSKYHKGSESSSVSSYSKPCPEARHPDSGGRGFASAGRGRGRGHGRGGAFRQKDPPVFSHQASQPALHPSWEASKKRKEQQGQILAFQGKKIKFDDDD